MKLTLFSKTEYTITILPEKQAGLYWIRGRNNSDKKTDIVAVEAHSKETAQWILKSNRNYKITDKHNKQLQSIKLTAPELYTIRSTDGSSEYTLLTEPLTDNRRYYQGYRLADNDTTLEIGRAADNNIIFGSRFVSGKHALLNITKGHISIQDSGSLNNTYVNGRPVSQASLHIGDVIYIMGLQIIIANRYIFINNPDGCVRVNSGSLRVYNPPVIADTNKTADSEEDFEDIPDDYYYRAPRFKHDVDELQLKLDAPPAGQAGDDVPMIMLIGPSMTMGMASIATGAYAVTNAISRGDITSAIPSIVMSISMLLGTLMWPLITKTYQRKNKNKKEAQRQKTYIEYLDKIENIINDETQRQKQILCNNDPETQTYIYRIINNYPQIWERTPKHTDFLALRLGYGDLPLCANIQYPEKKFTVEEDNLHQLLYDFCDKKRMIKNVPICLPLRERFISGIYANGYDLLVYAKALIVQLVALHSYDEVKIVLIYNESDESDLSFVRCLPHTMNNEKTFRYMACDMEEAKVLSGMLDPVIEYRKSISEDKQRDELPYYVVICTDKQLASKTGFVSHIQEHKTNIGFTVLSLFERLEDLPKECTAVAYLKEDNTGTLTLIGDVSEPPVKFTADNPPRIDINSITAVLANTYTDIAGAGFTLPRKYTFLEMPGVGMINHINLLENWAVSDPVNTLAAVVGIDKYGGKFKLDLHERAHGPHGLIAGMTGSGKSEFIITYVLSMALAYHPHEVAFILIDYKGGTMAKAFENIPHTAGVITNLDGNEIKRSLTSLRSELRRRQYIFGETTQKLGISNIDIYKYQKLFRDGKVDKPLPHLLIISDEFAELKKEQPDFMTELTSTARVGRSLGVHLILATQKPGGVVDDQIRSNSRFRICLKVQDTGDSMEMLGRPEAAALTDTGRFYMQIGNNEVFEIGQSAWAAAPYYPSHKVIKDRDDAISVINTTGQVIAEANTNRFAMIKDPPKQLDVITGYIAAICINENITGRKMWLDPINEYIFIDKLTSKYKKQSENNFILDPVAGEYDDPANQAQGILRIPITGEGNTIIYGSAGSGKAMFIEAICCSLLSEHTPGEVNIYILDFGSQTLAAFADAPHVGDVILSHETEKVNNLFKLMLGQLEKRKNLLSQFGGEITGYNIHADEPQPGLIVIINNYAAFAELFEDKTGDISLLTREGTKYGIYFILTCTGINNVRFSLLQNFKNIYCLQLNNPDDYSTVVGKTEGLVPGKFKGRGIFRKDKDSLNEFQTARITKEDPPYNYIRQLAKTINKNYIGQRALSVPVLPETVTSQFLLDHIQKDKPDNIPVGIEKENLDTAFYNFTGSPVTLVLSAGQQWQNFTEALPSLISKGYGIKTIILAPTGNKSINTATGNIQIYTDTEGCVKAVFEIFNIVLTRNNDYKTKLDTGEKLPEFEPLFVIIQSISLLSTMLQRYKPPADTTKETDDDTVLNRLGLAIEKNNSAYNVFFIIAESVNSLTPFTVDNWYKTHITGNNGIWIGSGINNQFRLNVSNKPPQYAQQLDSDFGFIINNTNAVHIKFLQSGNEYEDCVL